MVAAPLMRPDETGFTEGFGDRSWGDGTGQEQPLAKTDISSLTGRRLPVCAYPPLDSRRRERHGRVHITYALPDFFK